MIAAAAKSAQSRTVVTHWNSSGTQHHANANVCQASATLPKARFGIQLDVRVFRLHHLRSEAEAEVSQVFQIYQISHEQNDNMDASK